MGRKSTRENKTVYQLARERAELTLEEAENRMNGMTAERISRIEGGAIHIQPEDVLMMAECYKAPELKNYYCSHECAIGRETVPEIETKSIAQIAIETLNSLNRLTQKKDRLLEIVEDGRILTDELEDFKSIKETLDRISVSVSALQLWVDGQIAVGELNKEDFD